MNLVPVLGVAFAVVLLGEPLGLLQVLGGVVVIAGVTLSMRGDPKKAKPGDGSVQMEGEASKAAGRS